MSDKNINLNIQNFLKNKLNKTVILRYYEKNEIKMYFLKHFTKTLMYSKILKIVVSLALRVV